MNPSKVQLAKTVKRFFKKKPTADQPDLQAQFEQQRSGAKGAGVNPFDLPWTWDDRKVLALVLAKMTPSLPQELRNDIVGFASKPKFIEDFCIDMDTAGEIERILDREPALKSAMSKFPSAVKRLLGSNSPEALKPFKDIAAEILDSPAAPAVLRHCVETDINAILATTDSHKQFIAASLFLRRLAGCGIRTD